MRELFGDGFDGCRPEKGLGMLVPRRQKFPDRLFQVCDAMKGIATHPLARQFTKPALDQIQPTGTGGHKVGCETRVTPEPSAHLGVLVSAVVIQHQVQGHRAGKFLVQAAQKSQELLMPVALKALPYDPTLEHLESREQRGRAMAFIVVRQGAATALLQGQTSQQGQGIEGATACPPAVANLFEGRLARRICRIAGSPPLAVADFT